MGVDEGGVDGGRVGEDDEAEAAGAAGELVAHDGGLGDVAVGGEVVAELLLGGLPRDAADEQLPLIRLHLLPPPLLSPSLLPLARAPRILSRREEEEEEAGVEFGGDRRRGGVVDGLFLFFSVGFFFGFFFCSFYGPNLVRACRNSIKILSKL